MLRKLSGRPLIVESRLVPVVLTPGRNATAFSALRVAVGMRVSWSEFRVAATVPFSVLMSSELLVTDDRLFELADLERERDGDRLTGRDADRSSPSRS